MWMAGLEFRILKKQLNFKLFGCVHYKVRFDSNVARGGER